MIDPIPELPDDTPIGSVRLPTRLEARLIMLASSQGVSCPASLLPVLDEVDAKQQ